MQIKIDKNGKIQLPNFIVKMLSNNKNEDIKDYIELEVNSNDGTVILSKPEPLKIKYHEIYILKKSFPHIFKTKYNSNIVEVYKINPKKTILSPYLKKDLILRFVMYNEKEDKYIFEDMLYIYAFSKSFVIDYLERLNFTDDYNEKQELTGSEE